MKTFHLTVAKVGETLFDGEALRVTLPGREGEFTVLADHEAFVSPLKAGEARIHSGDGTKRNVNVPEGAIAEVSKNQATILL